MADHIKQIRGQLRQIAKELLPTVLAQEVAQEIYKTLSREIAGKLQAIDADVKEGLKRIEDKQKDIQSFIMREVIAVKDQHIKNAPEDVKLPSLEEAKDEQK